MREDRGNGAGPSGRFGSPRRRVQMLNQNLVHAIVGGEHPDRGAAGLSGHGSYLLIMLASLE